MARQADSVDWYNLDGTDRNCVCGTPATYYAMYSHLDSFDTDCYPVCNRCYANYFQVEETCDKYGRI
jgi:hypothetical protein